VRTFGPRLRLLATLSIATSSCSLDSVPTADAAPIIEPEPIATVTPTPVDAPAPSAAQAPVKADTLELTFVGDVVLGRYRSDERFLELERPDLDPFFEVREQLAADVVVGNLESPVMWTLPGRSPSNNKHRVAGSAAHV